MSCCQLRRDRPRLDPPLADQLGASQFGPSQSDQRPGGPVVPTPEEQALQDVILANLRRSTSARAKEDEQLRAVRAGLFSSSPTA